MMHVSCILYLYCVEDIKEQVPGGVVWFSLDGGGQYMRYGRLMRGSVRRSHLPGSGDGIFMVGV